MGPTATLFSATGEIQTYFVPATGGYLIEACGAQAASPDRSGAKGDLIKGMFYLNRGDILRIVVGCQQPSASLRRRMTCGGEGGSVIWRGAGELPLPAKLLLAAGGGEGDDSSFTDVTGWGSSFNAGAFQVNEAACHAGNGYVSIIPLPSYDSSASSPRVSREPRPSAPADTAFTAK